MNTIVTPTPPQVAPAAASATRRKIVIVCGFRIFPMNTGGHVRTGSIARALARLGHEVLIYSLAGRRSDYGESRDSSGHHLNQIAEGLSEETHLGMGYGLLQTVARRLDFPRFWQHALLRRGLIPRRLREALDRADVILSDMPWCPPIPGPWSGKPWLLLSHNLEYRLLEQGNPRHRRFASWMKRIESEAPHDYRDIFACAEEDLEFFRSHDSKGRLKLPLIRCGVDPASLEVTPGTRERVRADLGVGEGDRLVLFSGSGFGPNVEALQALRAFCNAEQQWLASERLFIVVVGSVATTAFREGNLIVTGRVPEVAPYFAAADAGLNPITRGSGANIKLFEYLAARLPVISTPFGVRGTPLEPDLDFLSFEPRQLKGALDRFVHARSVSQWRAFAEDVWVRHRVSCDIGELVRTAIAQVPAFAP